MSGERLRFFVASNRRTAGGAPAPLAGLNEIVDAERGGWGNALKKRECVRVQRCCEEAMGKCGWKRPDGRSVVTLTFVETTRGRDPDNIFGGAKLILDGMTMPRGRKRYGAGAIRDDSQRWIELRFGKILVDKDRPGCWVEVEEIEDGVQEPTG